MQWKWIVILNVKLQDEKSIIIVVCNSCTSPSLLKISILKLNLLWNVICGCIQLSAALHVAFRVWSLSTSLKTYAFKKLVYQSYGLPSRFYYFSDISFIPYCDVAYICVTDFWKRKKHIQLSKEVCCFWKSSYDIFSIKKNVYRWIFHNKIYDLHLQNR